MICSPEILAQLFDIFVLVANHVTVQLLLFKMGKKGKILIIQSEKEIPKRRKKERGRNKII